MDAMVMYSIAGAAFLGWCVFAWKKPGWGLGLLPFALTGLALAGLLEPVYEPILVMAAVLFPLTIGLVRWSPSGSPLETPWYRSTAMLVITVFQYLLGLAIFTLVFQLFGPILLVLFAVAVSRFKQARRFGLALEILSVIGVSMRQSLPLPMALRTAAAGQHRKEAAIFNAIAEALSQGHPLSAAMRKGYPQCPPAMAAAIAAAEAMNQLPRAIATLEQDLVEKVHGTGRLRPVSPWYPILIACAAFTIVLGLAFFIVPTFAEILSDMSNGQSSLPWLTQQLLNFTSWLRGRNGFNLLIACLPLVLLAALWSFSRIHGRRPVEPRLLSRLGDRIKWHLPVAGWFERAYSQLQLIEALKIGLRAGWPVNTTIRRALGLDMNGCYRRRLRQWLEQVEQGRSISDAAASCGIGRMLAWALDERVNKGNAPLLFESMEEVHRSRYHYRLNVANAILCPLLVLALGVSVGLVVTAMFLPMVQMIQIMIF